MRAFRHVFRTRAARGARRGVTALAVMLLLTACGKATLTTGSLRPGFTLTALQGGASAVIVDAVVDTVDFTPSYRTAFAERFGSADSLSSHVAALLIDSLNAGTPRLPAVLAPGLNPRHIIHVRNVTVRRDARDVPSALLPTGGQREMQAAGGGTSEAWSVSFEVDVWRPTGALPDVGDGYVATGQESDGTEPGSLIPPDSATGVKEYSFSVTGRADVPLYAYKTALVEAVNAAAAQAARHLGGRP